MFSRRFGENRIPRRGRNCEKKKKREGNQEEEEERRGYT